MVGWWLVRWLYYPLYIRDYHNPWTGNPYEIEVHSPNMGTSSRSDDGWCRRQIVFHPKAVRKGSCYQRSERLRLFLHRRCSKHERSTAWVCLVSRGSFPPHDSVEHRANVCQLNQFKWSLSHPSIPDKNGWYYWHLSQLTSQQFLVISRVFWCLEYHFIHCLYWHHHGIIVGDASPSFFVNCHTLSFDSQFLACESQMCIG